MCLVFATLWLYVKWDSERAHLMQKGSGPYKMPNFYHLLWSDGKLMSVLK